MAKYGEGCLSARSPPPTQPSPPAHVVHGHGRTTHCVGGSGEDTRERHTAAGKPCRDATTFRRPNLDDSDSDDGAGDDDGGGAAGQPGILRGHHQV